MSARNHIWIVEMYNPSTSKKRWEPTVGCAITKREAKEEMWKWERRDPGDRFRVVMYVAVMAP